MKFLFIPVLLALLYIYYPNKKNHPDKSRDRSVYLLLSGAAFVLMALYFFGLFPAISNQMSRLMSIIILPKGE